MARFNFSGFFDKESKRLMRNSSWVFFANFYSTGLAFLRSVILARGLGAAVFGSYTLVVAFVGLIQEFLNLNLGTALIRFGAGYHTAQRNDKLFALVKLCLRISGAMVLVSLLVIALLLKFAYAKFVQQPGLTVYILAYAIAAGITYFNSISRSMLRLYYRFRISSIIEIIMDTVETLIIACAVWLYPKDLHVFFPAIIVVRFLNGFICNIIAFGELRAEWKLHVYVDEACIREDRSPIRKFVLGNSLGNTMKTMISQGDVLLLGFLTSPVQVAYYVVAKKLAYAVLTLSDPLSSSIYPQLSRLIAERQYPAVRTMLKKISLFMAGPALLVWVVLYFSHQWLMVSLYGNEYRVASESFMYFLTGALLAASTFWSLPMVQSLGLVRMRIVAYLLTLIFGLVLSAWLVPAFQSKGMAIALLLTNVLNATIFIYFSFRMLAQSEREGRTII
jgi:O-antigen/teichoic acid export membrane protein